jgi:hypothetical protein
MFTLLNDLLSEGDIASCERFWHFLRESRWLRITLVSRHCHTVANLQEACERSRGLSLAEYPGWLGQRCHLVSQSQRVSLEAIDELKENRNDGVGRVICSIGQNSFA